MTGDPFLAPTTIEEALSSNSYHSSSLTLAALLPCCRALAILELSARDNEGGLPGYSPITFRGFFDVPIVGRMSLMTIVASCDGQRMMN
jgi:hypothetical protein